MTIQQVVAELQNIKEQTLNNSQITTRADQIDHL